MGNSCGREGVDSAPPSGDEVPNQPSEQTINMQDSVIGGDVVHNTVINNDPNRDLSVIAALQQMGMVGQSTAAPAASSSKLNSRLHSMLEIVAIIQPNQFSWLDRCIVGVNDDGTYRMGFLKTKIR